MSPPWIKLCGLTTPEAVEVACAAGVDAVGFVFHAPSPRNLTPTQARALAAHVSRGVLRVAVTARPSEATVDAIVEALAPDVLQADADVLPTLRLPPGLATLPVFRTGGATPAAWPARFVYEGAASGRGVRADWDAARAHARAGQLILAGGLSPDTVAAAVAAVRPFGVDVSSGVECAPGVKDPARIRAFVEAARAAGESR
jgi:phosphoribosylanthranilate isomerase